MTSKENIQEMTKDLSTYLSQQFKDKGIKKAEILEALSHYQGFKDWNTFKAQISIQYDPKDTNWSPSHYMHINNGGITFSYNKKKSLLMIQSSFLDYSFNQHIFKFTKKELDKLFFHIQKIYDAYIQSITPDIVSGNSWTIEETNLIFFQQNQEISIGLSHFSDKDMQKAYDSFGLKEPTAKDTEDDNSLFAVISTLNAGYDFEKKTMVELNFAVGQKFKVKSVNIGRSSTSIQLYDFNEIFNSVFFNFVGSNGMPKDIFTDPKYNYDKYF